MPNLVKIVTRTLKQQGVAARLTWPNRALDVQLDENTARVFIFIEDKGANAAPLANSAKATALCTVTSRDPVGATLTVGRTTYKVLDATEYAGSYQRLVLA